MHNVTEIEQAAIIFLYSMIAWQFRALLQKESYKTAAGKSALCLMVIFVLCGLSGYASYLFHGFYPHVLSKITHVLLIGVSSYFVLNNLASDLILAIKKMIDDND